MGVDYIIISYGHLFRVSHRVQELWESTTSSSATVTYSESHTDVGVDYIIISYGHLFRVSHRAQELWESRWTSWGPRPARCFFVDVKQH